MWSHFGGFLMVTVAGFLWIAIGIAVSKCSARGWNYNIVQGLTYLGASLLCAVIVGGRSLGAGTFEFSPFGFFMCCLAGFSNFYIYVFTAKAMQRGPNGLVWGIMQSGLIGTFLMGMIFFGEKPSLPRVAGALLILCGVLVMGLAKDRKSPGGQGGKAWLLFSLCAMLLSMITQCCNTLPSYFPEIGENGASVLTLGMYCGGLLGFAFTTLPGLIRKRDFGCRSEWIMAGILMILNTSASLIFFYRGLDMLAKNGCAGLGYPLSIGVCVIGFSFYSLLILKEKFARLSLIGLGAVCIGIIAVSIR